MGDPPAAAVGRGVGGEPCLERRQVDRCRLGQGLQVGLQVDPLLDEAEPLGDGGSRHLAFQGRELAAHALRRAPSATPWGALFQSLQVVADRRHLGLLRIGHLRTRHWKHLLAGNE